MKKILIIEDEKVLLEVLQKKLTVQGYEVITAQNGDEGISKIKEHKPDLVLLDIIMPKKDGFEVLTEIRKDSTIVDIPVIIISNSGQAVEIDKALALGAKDYLIKTEFDPEGVLEKVAKILGKGTSPSPKLSVAEEEKGAPENNNIGSAGKILIVEDDKFLRDLITKKLKMENFETICAIDGEEALKKIKEEKPALILLDLILPGIGGFDVLSQLKNDLSESIKNIPVIILSNLGQRDDVEKGINLGAVDFLIKAHFTPGEIISKIKEVLNKK